MELDFRVVNSYELPKQFMSMFLDQELTAKTAGLGISEAVSGNPLLTPIERDRLSHKVKAAFNLGENKALDAFLEVATNPLSYLAFIPALGAGARLAVGKVQYSPWMQRTPSVLMALGLESGAQAFRGTSIPPVLADVIDASKRFADESTAILRPSYEKMVRTAQSRGVRELTGMRVKGPGPAQDYRHELDALLQIYLEGLNKPVKTKMFRTVDVDEAGEKLKVKFSEGQRDALVDMTDAQVESALEAYGALDFAKAVRADQKRVVESVFGKTKDERIRNASRMFYSMRGVANSKSHEQTALAKATMQSLFGANMEEALRAGEFVTTKGGKKVTVALDDEAWGELVNEAIEIKLSDPNFVSRNTFTARDSVGNILSPNAKNSAMYDYGLIPSGSTMPRVADDVVFGSDDLEVLKRVQSKYAGKDTTTTGWADQWNKSTKYDQSLDQEVTNIRRRLNVLDSHSNYLQTMNGTKVLFVDEMSEQAKILEKETLVAFRDRLAKVGKDAPKGTLRTIGQGDNMPVDILTPLMDVGPNQGPKHGLTRADALDRAYRLIDKDNVLARDLFRTSLLPHILGETTTKSMAGSVMLAKARDMTSWFLGTDAAKVLKGQAPSIYEKLERVSKTDIPAYGSSSLQHRIGSHLYGTHLGLNMKSVIFNLTQPLITMPAHATFGDMMAGYGAGIKKMVNYFEEAFQTKGAFLNPEVSRNLRRKHFDLVGSDAGDMLGLTDDLMDTLDIGRTGARIALNDGGMSLTQKIMIPFQHGEMSNRVITSEIIRAKLKRQGLDPFSKDARSKALARAEIRSMVEETQFGASGLNTLMAAYGGGKLGPLLSQPLMRQFLTFPLRMMTLPIATLPRISDRGWLGAAGMMGRTVGYSAIAYEVLRSDLVPGGGFDASDFLVVGGTTQLISGAVDDRDGIFPVPPVLSIPTNMAKGMLAGDRQMIGNEMFRTLPAGVAIGRIMKELDPGGLFMPDDNLLRQVNPYNRVGWDQKDENGEVPIFDPEGRLIQRARPLDLVLRSAGLDMNKFANSGELDNFLVKQRDQMVQYERRIIQATLNGDHGKAQQIAAEFQKRFGFKPQISRAQFQTALQNKQLDRTERILSRLDPQIRSLYGQIAEERRGQPIQSADREQLKGEAGVAQAALNDIMMRLGGP